MASASTLESAVFQNLARQVQSERALARSLGVSDDDIRDALVALGEKGLELRETAQGLALPAGLEPLDARRIRQHLEPGRQERLEPLQVAFAVGSTNDELNGSSAESGTLLAEFQSAGRGRSGRHWVSPLGANLYISVKRRFPPGVKPAGCLSLGVGQAVASRLAELGVVAGVKWPNDIYVSGRKLAGILIDSRVDGEARWRVVIGIGVNYDLPRSVKADPALRATDFLSAVGRQSLDRNGLAAVVIGAVDEACQRFLSEGAAAVTAAWPRWDAFPRARVRCFSDGEPVEGYAEGIDEQGRLLVSVGGGRIAVNAGEVDYQALSDADTGRG